MMARRSLHIVSATNPVRYEGQPQVWLKVWFEEFDGPLEPYCASPFDCEGHGKELWIRAMAGEYGPVEVKSMPLLPKPSLREVGYGNP